MGRPKKYTLKFCLAELKSFQNLLDKDKASKQGKYITWHDLVEDKPYSRQRISEWRRTFESNQGFSDAIKKIEGELENRLYKLALANKVNAAVAIFGLKNNFNWKDKQEITGADGKDLIPARTLTKEEAREYLNKIENEY
jgi:hypothetical protein